MASEAACVLAARARARARSGRSPLPAPGPDEVLVRTLFSGGQPGHRDPRLPRRGAAGPVRDDARAVPGGRVPGAGEVRLPQRRRGRPRVRPSCSAGPCSASTRTRPRTWCRPSAVVPVPDGVPAERAVLAGTVETAVNALWDAAPRIGDRVTVVGAGHGRLLRGRAAGPVPRRARCSWSTPIPARAGGGRRRSASPFAAPADAAAGPGPGRARQRHRPPGCSGRWSCSRRRAPCSS